MRKIAYIVILGLLFFAPLERADMKNLLPIEAVGVFLENDKVVLKIDQDRSGIGENVARALEDLKKSTPAVVYLDTAAYLLISEEALPYLEELRSYLRSSVEVCVCDPRENIEQIAQYLSVHGGLTKLRDFDTNNYQKRIIKKR